MAFVVTLISNPDKARLSETLAEKVRTAFGAEAPDWLSPGVACDLKFETQSSATEMSELTEKLSGLIDGEPVDGIVQPTFGRKKHLLIADMDSTMIHQECIDELAAEVGLKEQVAEVTERAMRGELEFESSLKERVALLKGLSLNVVDRVIRERIELTPGGRQLVQTMRNQGAYTALVSGGFTVFVEPVAAMIGFNASWSNLLLSQDNMLTGTVAEPILGRDAKRERLTALLSEQGLDFKDALAVGDGANDMAMLSAAGLGVAFRAKPAVAAQADAVIDHGDMTALLYLQGYRDVDFVAD